MTDVVVKAVYATVTDEDGARFIGFVDATEESYAMFRQDLAGGPVWFELNDEDFGADDAVAQASIGPGGLELVLHPALSARFGYARQIAVRLKACDGAEAALAALQKMLGPVFIAA